MRIYHATWCHLSKTDSFVRKDDEVEGLLRVIIEYKVVKTSENVDWESCQTKHSDILDLLIVRYLQIRVDGRRIRFQTKTDTRGRGLSIYSVVICFIVSAWFLSNFSINRS